MARENGGIVGIKGVVNQNYAAGAFNIKSQFINNQASLWPRSGSIFLGVAHALSPFFSVYPFSSLGFGAKLSNPATLPAGLGNGITFSPNGKMVAISHDTTPFIAAYPFSGSGIGTKFSNPGTLPTGGGNGIIFNNSSNTVAIAMAVSPGIHVYPIDSVSGFGTKYSNAPTTLGNTYGIDFSPDGNNIAAATASTPFLTVYPFSISSGLGSKYSDPASNLTNNVTNGMAIRFHPSGNFITAGYETSGTTSVSRIERTYPFVSGTGFGASYYDTTVVTPQLSGSASQGADSGGGIDVHSSGNDVAFTTVTNNGGSYISVYVFNQSTGFTSKYSSPATDLTGIPQNGAGRNIEFSPDGNYIAAAHATTPFVGVYPWTTGTGFGTKITAPATLPPSTSYGVGWGRV